MYMLDPLKLTIAKVLALLINLDEFKHSFVGIFNSTLQKRNA